MTNEFEVIIPACGKGKRFGASIPKQFAEVEGAPVLIHTLRCFTGMKGLFGIIIVCDPGFKNYIKSLLSKYSITGVNKIVVGGEKRQDSVRNALKFLQLKKTVVIHDAVRPCVKRDVIVKGIDYAVKYGASCASRPATQTLGIVRDGFIVEKLDRKTCWILQTPQSFQYEILVDSYRKAHKESFIATDDTQVVMTFSNKKVRMYWSNEENVKITYKRDLEIVASFLKKT